LQTSSISSHAARENLHVTRADGNFAAQLRP
jgi:hypothetical protein